MAASDTFPLAPDYTVTRTKEANVLRGRAESAREFLRQKAAPRRLFILTFTRRPKSDWDSLELFRQRMLTDFFTFTDPSASPARSFSCYFDGEPAVEEVGNEAHNMQVRLVEAVGVALQTYPTFAAGHPSVNLPVAQATDLGASGKQWIYPGYGYRVNGTFTSIFLDEVDTGGSTPKTDVVLGLHRLRVVGGAPTSLDYLI